MTSFPLSITLLACLTTCGDADAWGAEGHEALLRQVDILESKAPDTERLTALKWVIHLVDDLHQPLHAGFKADKGGNLHQVQAFGRGTNLHSLWDGVLLRNRAGGLDGLRHDASTTVVAKAEVPSPSACAAESCEIVATQGFYPDARNIDRRHTARWDAVLVARLKSAATRLAATLNGALH